MVVAPPPFSAASVTAVIPAHNAARTLGTALTSLAGVGEILVVDDGSTDDTAEVARAHGARLIRHAMPLGPAAARNAGIRNTHGDLVLLLDADAELAAGWLDPLLAHLADPLIGGVAPRVRAPGDATALGRYEAAAGPLDLGPVGGTVRPDGPVPFVSTTALLLRRSAWEAVGGFAEELRFGEDVDLGWRLAALGRPLVYEPAVTVWHGHRPHLRGHLVNRYHYGTASGPLARRHHGFPRAAVAPPVLSIAFAVSVLGLRRVGVALAAGSVAIDAGTLRRAGLSERDAIRQAVKMNAGATRGLAAGVSRPWLPLAILAAVVVPRSRLPVVAAIVARSVAVRRRTQPDLAIGPWMALRGLDDFAFSAGVIRGCVEARTAGPLLPASSDRLLLDRSGARRRGRPAVMPDRHHVAPSPS